MGVATMAPPATSEKMPGPGGSAQWKPPQPTVKTGDWRPGTNDTVWVAASGSWSMLVYARPVAELVIEALNATATLQR